ncbi:MAG: toll/interleukin-1 receptor domain-containing protein, partial [Anaerolineales bacterium]|nr:toll/interleukin-1 receptor domain-containing protein [Anaerolineales bacterium]
MSHIFISYSHKDTVYAHGLAKTLYDDGFEVWIDERLDYGSQWPLEIQKQLDSCSAFIVIMTPRAFASEWVQSELQRAKRKNKPIFPLLLEGDETWLSVESTQYFDVRGHVFPDSKFYFALKRVISPNPSARTIHTIKVPDLLSGVTLEKDRPKRKLGIAIAIVGLLFVSFVACGTLLVGSLLGGWFKPSSPLP